MRNIQDLLWVVFTRVLKTWVIFCFFYLQPLRSKVKSSKINFKVTEENSHAGTQFKTITTGY
jgi:hypothetical protein